MDFTSLDDDSLRKVFSYLSFKDHFNLCTIDPRFENVVYTACKYIYVKLTVRDPVDQSTSAESDEPTMESVFYRLITNKADDKFKEKYQIFNFVEKLQLQYKIDEPIDLSFMVRLKELNLNFTAANNKCPFIDDKEYPNVKTLFVRDYSARYQKLFPGVRELGFEFIQNDIQSTDTVHLLCINTIYPDVLPKFTNLKMVSLDLNNNLFNSTQLPQLLIKVPTLNKLHINFWLRKNTLSSYTRAIMRLVNVKIELKHNVELCVHLHSTTKDHPTANTYNYRDSEIRYFKENARQFLPHLVTFQINDVEVLYDTLPDTAALFEMVGTQVVQERELISFIGKDIGRDISSYLKNLKTVKLTTGTDDFFGKLVKLTSKLKEIEINCPVKQHLLNSIPVHYKDITSFSLYDQNGEYDIAFLKSMRHLDTLKIQIGEFKNVSDLQTIISNCIFLNYITINVKHYELVKDDLINIYEERSIRYPFTTIILTVRFDPVQQPAQTSYQKITDRFSVHILPDIMS